MPSEVAIAYLDESGVDGYWPHVAVAGYVGTREQWALFETKWQACLDGAGLTHFHAKDRRSRPLWNVLEQEIARAGLWGMLVTVPSQAFHRSASGRWRATVGNAYATCALACVGKLSNHARAMGWSPVRVVLDGGQPNVSHVVRLLTGQVGDQRFHVASVATAQCRATRPLQAADYLAHIAGTHRRSRLDRLVGEGPGKALHGHIEDNLLQHVSEQMEVLRREAKRLKAAARRRGTSKVSEAPPRRVVARPPRLPLKARRRRAMLTLNRQLARVWEEFNDARVWYRKPAQSTRIVARPGDKRKLGVHRDRLVNSLVNRCLSLVRSVELLSKAELDDDAYALCRVLFEATVHLGFITSGKWTQRVDTFAGFLHAFHLKARDEFLKAEQLEQLDREDWLLKERWVNEQFGQPYPRSWLVFPKDDVPATVQKSGRAPKGRGDLRQLGVGDEYEMVFPRRDGEPESFFMRWVYHHGSSFVHSDVVSTYTAGKQLEDSRHYRLAVPVGATITAPHTFPMVVGLHVATLKALYRFVGLKSQRLDRLEQRWVRLMRTGGGAAPQGG